MSRRIFTVFLLAFLAACGSKDTAPLKLSQTIADWTLGDSTSAANAGNPTWTITYQGSPRIVVNLTRMSNNTLAFSAVQNWRAETGKLAFFHGRFFGIAESPAADQRTLNRFVTAFEKTLPE